MEEGVEAGREEGGREVWWEGRKLFTSLPFLRILMHSVYRMIGLKADERGRGISQENNHNHTNIII